MRTQRVLRIRDRLGVRVKIALCGEQRSVPRDLAQNMNWDSSRLATIGRTSTIRGTVRALLPLVPLSTRPLVPLSTRPPGLGVV
jgi:hypothetical protein